MIDYYDYDLYENGSIKIDENNICHIPQTIVINLLINNKLKLDNQLYSLIYNQYGQELSSDLCYYLYKFDENNHNSYRILLKMLEKYDYSYSYLNNINSNYSKLDNIKKNIVLDSFYYHNIHELISKRYMIEDFQNHQTSNRIEDCLNTKINNKINRAIGLELELISDIKISQLANKFNLESILNVNDLVASDYKNWTIKEDGSIKCRNDQEQVEIVSPKICPLKINDELNILDTILKSNINNFSVNDSCGFHVHIDISDIYNLDDIIQNTIKKELYHHQDKLYSLCDPSRIDNIYCPKFDKDQKGLLIEKEYEGKVSQKRPGFNIFTGYKTIEFRMKESILNIDEIKDWIHLCYFLTEMAIAKAFCNETLYNIYYSEYINLVQQIEISKKAF